MEVLGTRISVKNLWLTGTPRGPIKTRLPWVFAILFVLVGGWLGDRFPIRRTLFVFGLLEACAVGVLAFAESLPMFIFRPPWLAWVLAGCCR